MMIITYARSKVLELDSILPVHIAQRDTYLKRVHAFTAQSDGRVLYFTTLLERDTHHLWSILGLALFQQRERIAERVCNSLSWIAMRLVNLCLKHCLCKL